MKTTWLSTSETANGGLVSSENAGAFGGRPTSGFSVYRFQRSG
jgi:hypothetical protein